MPADARVIDVKGLTVTPGLIDGFGGVGLPAPRSAAPRRRGRARRARAPARSHPRPWPSIACALADALKARDAGVTTALVVPREGVLPGRSVLLNLGGEKPEGMVLRQPAALHLHMATLSRASIPASLMGTVAYARQAALRRRPLPRGVGRLREGAARPQAAALRRGPRGLAGRAGRQAAR